jgi:TolB-like protein/Flp pilus assembly protein TadD
MIVGTAAYMSPEQARGKQIDPRTDIFSFGVVLYEMLTLKQPFEGENPMDLIGAILHKEPKPIRQLLPEIPQDIERLINKTLRKDREERYQTAKDLLIDLRDAKQELEAQSRLERTTPLNQEGPDTLILTAATVDIPHTTSSAEYLVSEITKRKRSLAVLVVLLASIGLGYWVFGNRAAPAKQIESIAVMPFVNVSRDPNTEYLSDGISESLINSMSQWSQLKVIARSSVFKYKGKEIDPEEVAKTLGVGAIVTGRVVQRGDELQVSVELMNAQNKTQMWGEQYNRRAADLQAVQAEIARTISEKLRLRLTGAQEQQLTKQATGNPEAYQLYLTGLFYFQKGNIENIKKALDYYTQAVALDPKFAPAYASMAVAYSNLTTSGADPAEMLAKGRAAAQKALELDDSLAEAHAALAIIKRDEWDWSGAEREYKRAVELNPNYAGAHGNYALYLSRMGRAAEALSENKRAQEIDPLRIVFKSNEGAILYFARRYDEAIQVSQNVIRMQPDYANAHIYLGYTYEMKGMYAEAIAAYQKDISLDGETPSLLCYLGYAYAMSGKRGEALVILGKLKRTKEHVSPIELATLYVGLEDKEAALESLERAYREHDLQMQFLKVEPHFDSLRSEARFADLMGRVGLPQ